jgi:hypothetical protein
VFIFSCARIEFNGGHNWFTKTSPAIFPLELQTSRCTEALSHAAMWNILRKMLPDRSVFPRSFLQIIIKFWILQQQTLALTDL